jgi:hypothetical protein
MELSFELIDYLNKINENPEHVVLWAAFGVPALLAALAIPFGMLRKIGVQQAPSVYAFVAAVFLCNWLMGFVSQMAFMILGVPGIKMLLLWLIMFFIYSIFVSLNYAYIKKWVDEVTKNKIEK